MADVPVANVSVKVRSSQGRRKFRVAVITSDGSGVTIPATSLDMTYIDHAIIGSQQAAMSDETDYAYLSYATATTVITMAGAGSDGATMDLQAWGW